MLPITEPWSISNNWKNVKEAEQDLADSLIEMDNSLSNFVDVCNRDIFSDSYDRGNNAVLANYISNLLSTIHQLLEPIPKGWYRPEPTGPVWYVYCFVRYGE